MVPSTAPSLSRIGSDQQALSPKDRVKSRGPAHKGSVAMSVTMTGSLRKEAVPQEPTLGPISSPSMAAQ